MSRVKSGDMDTAGDMDIGCSQVPSLADDKEAPLFSRDIYCQYPAQWLPGCLHRFHEGSSFSTFGTFLIRNLVNKNWIWDNKSICKR